MLKERKSILIIRSVCISLLLIYIIVPLIIYFCNHVDAKANNLNVNYNATTNTSYCFVDIEFNKIIYSGKFTLVFLDEDGNQLKKITQNIDSLNDKTTNFYFTIKNGKVATCEVVQCKALSAFTHISLISAPFLWVLGLIFVIESLHLNYKIYRVNEKRIIIYGGFYHNYLKIDGEIIDEHNTLISFKKIKLIYTFNNDEKDSILATISLTKRIRLYKNKELLPYHKNLFNK